MAALLLNDVYALAGRAPRPDARSPIGVRSHRRPAVKRGKLRRAFDEEFAARLEEAFLEVTDVPKRAARSRASSSAFQRSLSRVPNEIREWLNAEAVTSEADRADAT